MFPLCVDWVLIRYRLGVCYHSYALIMYRLGVYYVSTRYLLCVDWTFTMFLLCIDWVFNLSKPRNIGLFKKSYWFYFYWFRLI